MPLLAAHPYLILTLLVLAAGLASLAGSPRHVRRSASVAALLALPYSLTALGFEDYWHPARLGDVPGVLVQRRIYLGGSSARSGRS